jgi:acyl-CoA reductase-like NAD-dependent aldehyde dehydrogenase
MFPGVSISFFSRDLSRAWRVAEALEVGMVGINGSVALCICTRAPSDNAPPYTVPRSHRLVPLSAVSNKAE